MTRLLPPQIVNLVSGGMRGPLLAALLTLVCAMPLVFLMPPLDRDESRFAQATSQMLETGDYININYQDTPRHKKPIGIHWLQAMSVKLTSTVAARDIAPYRLPSLLGAALAAFACAWGASRAFGTRIGTKAGLLFGVTFMLATEAFFAKTDAVMCGLIVLMMAALGQIYLRVRDLPADAPKPKILKLKFVMWLSLAAAILVKGPVPAMVFGSAILALWALDRRIGWARHLGWLSGLILVALICGPWAIAITVTTDGAFWASSIGGDLKDKLDSGSEGHFGLPGYHLLLLSATLFPASWLFGGAIQTAIQRWKEPAVRFAIAWFVPTFLIFELMPTKLPHYPLPVFAAVAWLCAVSLDVPLKRWAQVVNWVCGLLGGVIFTAIVVYAQREWGSPSTFILALLTTVGALVVGPFAGWLLWRKHHRYGFGFLLAAGVVCHLGLFTLAASLKPLWMSRQMEQALTAAQLDPRLGKAPGPVATLGFAEPSFVFAMGTRTRLCNEDASCAVQAVIDGRPVFVESRQEQAFQDAARAAGITPRRVTQVSGHNYNGHDEVLTLYRNPPQLDTTGQDR